jgi:hypothetical protein
MNEELGKKLASLLKRKPKLAAALIEALEIDRFFVTISFQKKARGDDGHDLQHFWHREKFNTHDVIPSLKHVAADYNAKENPTAAIEGEGWY